MTAQLKADAGESISQFTKRLVRNRPAVGEFNGIELDIPAGEAEVLLADALSIIYALRGQLREKR